MPTMELTDYQVLERLGCPLHYWLAGPENAPLVVFTHGATVDHRTFAAQVPVLAQGYRVLVWDVRGHGESQPMGERFSVRLAMEDLLALIDHVGRRQAILVGQSMGGNISQELVFHHSETVSALAMIGSACNTLRLPALDMLALHLSAGFVALSSPAALRSQIAALVSSDPQVRAYYEDAAARISPADLVAIWDAVTRCIHPEPGYRIEQPLLLTHGEHDRFGRIQEQARLWARRDPCCRLVVIPHAGHSANQDNPGFFNRVLLEFLAKPAPHHP